MNNYALCIKLVYKLLIKIILKDDNLFKFCEKNLCITGLVLTQTMKLKAVIITNF